MILTYFKPVKAFLLCLLSLPVVLPATAADLPAPTGPVVLTISGNIANTNTAESAQFDHEMLRTIGTSEIISDTIWTSGTNRFVGTRLSDILEYVGAQGDTINAIAINDYRVSIPVSDAVPDGPIIAYEMNGAQMSRRDKGPLWVIYPFSSSSDYQSEVIYSRSIWQLDRIIISE